MALVMAIAALGANGAAAVPAAAAPVQAKPKPVKTKSVTGVHAVAPHPVRPADAASHRFQAKKTHFPKAASAQITVPGAGRRKAVEATGTPITLTEVGSTSIPDASAAVLVRQLTPEVAATLGINGTVFTLSSHSKQRRALKVVYDYGSFAQAFGGNYGPRLGLVQLPECALSTPAASGCQAQAARPATNDANAQVITARIDVPASSSVVLAVTPSPVTTATASTALLAATTASGSTSGDGGGAAGSYGATTLNPSGSWAQGGSTGSFTYSYPINLPTSATGLAPSVNLGYDSGSVDAKTSATSAQASWAGDGWGTPQNFIEQSFESCKDVDSSLTSVDQCYAGPVLTLSLNGVSTSLVCNATYTSCTPQQDDGAEITYKTGGTNGTWDGDYWIITQRDGTKYYFGLNQLPGYSTATSPAATNSVQTVPVYSATSAGPCYHKTADTFAGSACTMAYRWNLDYTVDLHGAAMGYYYTQDTNYYGQNKGATRTKYVRDAYLAHIDYGFTDGNAYGKVGNKVVFGTGVRCVASSCPTLSSSTASSYPDVPFDLICASTGTCTNYAPSFFSTARLTTITTQQYSTAAAKYVPVDKYALTQTIPSSKTGDSSAPTLWLSSVQRTASTTDSAGTTTSASMPSVDFTATQLQNRVDTTTVALPPMYRNRVGSISTETGSVITVLYDRVSACSSPVKLTASSNTSSCFPVTWTPEGLSAPVSDWFNKYVVMAVNQTDTTGGAPDLTTSYTYKGGAAWHYDDNEVVKKKYRSYGQFRGYGEVQTRAGDGVTDAQTLTDTTYYRGMSKNNSTTAVTVSDSLGGEHEDLDKLQGKVLETRVYQGSGGGLDHTAITSYWQSAATATRTRTGLTDLTANIIGSAETLNRQWIAPWGTTDYRTTETDTAYDTDTGSGTYGLPLYAYSHSVPANANFDTCTSTTYAKANTDVNLVGLVAQVETDSVACSGFTEGNPVSVPNSSVNKMGAPSSVSRPAQVVSATRSFYDDKNFGTAFPQASAPSAGLVTMTETASGASSNTLTWQVTAKNVYGTFGRLTSTTDGMGRASTTDYTDNAYGLTTAMTVTNNLKQSTSTTLNPERGLALTVTDPNKLVTTSQYDPFGRVTSVWLPSEPISDPANYTYSYAISKTGVTGATTKKLNSSSGYSSAVTLYDALLRTRQTQVSTPQGGRMVTDTIYDSRGMTHRSNNGWFDSSSTPNTTIVSATNLNAQVPNADEYTYDGLGRVVVDSSWDNQVEISRTVTVYSGDRTTVVPPTGGTISTVVTDVLGRAVEQDQYTSAPTVTPPSNTTTGHWKLTGGVTTATKYGYDGHGNQSTVEDADGNVWTTGYDVLGRVVGTSDPDAGSSTMSYNANGELLQSTDSRGKTVSYKYDTLGRKTATYEAAVDNQIDFGKTGANQTAAWEYDNPGSGSTVTNPIGHVTTATTYANGGAYITQAKGFTALGASLGQTITIPNTENSALAGSYTFTHTYHPSTGLPLKDLYPASGSTTAGGLPAETVQVGYQGYMDVPFSLTSAIGLYGSAYTSKVEYDAYGRVSQATLGSSSATGMAYVGNVWDEHTGQLTSQSVTRSPTSPAAVDKHTYQYDLSGALLRDVETRFGSADSSETQCYSYDGVDRLAAAWTATDNCATAPSSSDHSMVGDKLGAGSAYWTSWTYNAVGERLTQVDHSTTGGADTTTTNTYDGDGKKQPNTLTGTRTTGAATGTTAYQYDSAGNMISRNTARGSQALTWSDKGQLATVSTTDSSGKSTNSSFVYDNDGNLLIQHDGDATVLYLPNEQISVSALGVVSSVRYYALPGGGTAYRTGTADNYGYKISGPYGTSTLALDDTGQVPTFRQFTPFGEARGTAPSSWVDNRAFLDKTTDAVTGLTNMGARFYDPDIGDFISLDPILSPGQPQSLNGYSYAGNDPVSHADPTGLATGSSNVPAQYMQYIPSYYSDIPGSPRYYEKHGGGSTGNTGTTTAGSNGYSGAVNVSTNTGGAASTNVPEQHHGWCHWPSWHTVAKVAVGIAVGVAVTAAVAGICATGVGCVILAATAAGAASGAATYGTSVAVGDDEFSVKGLATATAVGAVAGAVTGGLGVAAGAIRTAATSGAASVAEGAGEASLANSTSAAARAATTGASKSAGKGAASAAGKSGPEGAEAAEGGAAGGCHSFAATTAVLMADGDTKPIGEVQVGDKVLATDPQTGENTARLVTALHHNHDADLADVTVQDAKTGKQTVLHTTWNHPFWNAGTKEWTEAKDLKRGDQLRGPSSEHTQKVARVKLRTGLEWMDDLTVATTHTYYVLAGTTPVLVHNCGGYDLRGKDPMSIVPDNASVRELTPHPNGGSQYGLEFKWTNDAGKTVRLRIHGPDGTAPAGSNSATGETYRVQIGRQYQDEAGNLFHAQSHNPNSPNYNPDAANATHIPWPSQFPGL